LLAAQYRRQSSGVAARRSILLGAVLPQRENVPLAHS
jgi:hypothetical protein